jgi:hypothetical protein
MKKISISEHTARMNRPFPMEVRMTIPVRRFMALLFAVITVGT